MSRRLLVVPTGHEVGLTSVCLGIVRALDRLGVRVGFLKPVRQSRRSKWPVDRSTALIRLTTALEPPDPIPQTEVERLLGHGDEGTLLDLVAARFQEVADKAEVVVIEGLVPSKEMVYSTRLNVAIAKALDAELVLVGTTTSDDPKEVANGIDIAARAYGDLAGGARSVILNKVRVSGKAATPAAAAAAPVAQGLDFGLAGSRAMDDPLVRPLVDACRAEGYHVLGAVPRKEDFAAPRVKDLARELNATVLHEGEWESRRFAKVALCAASLRYSCDTFKPGTLVITPGDREDIIAGVALAELSGTKLAALLLTGGRRPEDRVLELCRPGFERGLPVLLFEKTSFETATAVHEMSRDVPPDDKARAELVMSHVANELDQTWLKELAKSSRAQRVTAAMFRYQVIERARRANKRIVLPEGDEPRTVAAAAICQERGIARCVLLADPDSVRKVAAERGVTLPPGLEILDPKPTAERYVAPLCELRKSKGLTEAAARAALEDTVYIGTLLLKLGEVDGLVSGAIHTTANTIRPAFQIIKTAPGHKLVSSVFFMCLPEQTLVYGDCAVNPDPTAEELAEIAIQSAESAAAFAIEPRVAMISYSTGDSGEGKDVDKVKEAVKLAKARKPDLLLDGPLQYDAAAIAEVGKKKAPGSKVAGQATVFVFPDLNTGNTTYKAVQRSANCISVGPMLQGLAKPVNDLSRGCLVEDIVFTIALTAIQSMQAAPT